MNVDHGLTDEILQKLKMVFKRHTRIEKVVLYGSRALGRQKPASDIDLTFLGADLDYAALMTVGAELDDLLLPYQIDLSIYEQIENSDLRDHIDRVGVTIYP